MDRTSHSRRKGRPKMMMIKKRGSLTNGYDGF
jgi:hypothetical protein